MSLTGRITIYYGIFKSLPVLLIFGFTNFFFPTIYGQNLLPNPGFEDVNTCETFHAKCSREGWKNEYGGKPNFQESTTRFKARSGSTFTYLKLWQKGHPHAREWMQAPLICPLEKGARYAVTLFVKPRYHSLTNLGFTFSDTAICDFSNYYVFGKDYVSPLPSEVPDISFYDSSGLVHYQKKLFSKKTDWLRLTDTFIANGTEQYVFIGNFQAFEAIQPREVDDKGHRARCLYLIDDVSIHPLDSTGISNCNYEANLKSIYEDNVRHYCPDKGQKPKQFSGNTKDFDIGKTFVMENIQFKFDSDTLLNQAYPSLDSLVSYLNNNKNLALLIKGHTDSVGSYQYNMHLSKQRAKAVKKYLTSQGIDAQRLTTKGLGYTEPIAREKTPGGRKKNRRVAFLIIGKE